MSFVNCPICLEALLFSDDNQSTVPCGHVFHDTCIRSWIGRVENPNCPQCRAPLRVNGILRLHFSTSDTGSFLSDLREELKVTQQRLKETEASCALVLEESEAEQLRLRRQFQNRDSCQRCQLARAGIDGQEQRDHQIFALQEELGVTKSKLEMSETMCSSVLEQSNEQITKLTTCLHEAQQNAATLVEQCNEQQRNLQAMLYAARQEASVIEEHSVVEQSKLQTNLQRLQSFAASVEDQAIVEQSRLQECLRETLARASVVVEESVKEQSRLKNLTHNH